MQDQPLSALAASLMETDSVPAQKAAYADSVDHSHGCGHGWWSFVFWFLVLAVFFYFVYFALKPDFVLKKDCHDSSDSRSYGSYSHDDHKEIDNGRLLGAAIVTALLLIFLVWVLTWLAGSAHGSAW